MTGPREPDGLLPVDKPPGPTSHDIVALARRELGLRRIGHAGTLDPFASGLLLLCLGRSTRLAEYVGALPKEYVARARLGERTATDDPEGEVVERSEAWDSLTREQVVGALAGLEGEIEQRPPPYSAKKVGGRAAYRLAREGEEVDLAPVPVTVHQIRLEELALPEVVFRVRCSAGTYVRALARDLGERLGVGAHLRELRRTSIGPFPVESALSPDRLGDCEAVAAARISPLDAVGHLPRLDLDAEAAALLASGRPLSAAEVGAPEVGSEMAVAVEGRLLALAVRDGDRVRPRKVFPRE